MKIIIERSEILKHDPCPEGLKLFDEFVKLQNRKNSVVLRGPLAHVWIFVHPETRVFAAWARNKGIIPAVNLSGANLSEANLSEAHRYPSDSKISGWKVENEVLIRE